MLPRTRLGRWRADGYTDPSGSRISGPSAPARGPTCRGVQQGVDAARTPLHVRVGHDHPVVNPSFIADGPFLAELGHRAIHSGSVPEIAAGRQQPDIGVTLNGGLGCSIRRAVIGQQNTDRPLGGQRQRRQEPLQVGGQASRSPLRPAGCQSRVEGIGPSAPAGDDARREAACGGAGPSAEVVPEAAVNAATSALRHGLSGVKPAAAHAFPDSAE